MWARLSRRRALQEAVPWVHKIVPNHLVQHIRGD